MRPSPNTARWLIFGVVLLLVLVIVGGGTYLTATFGAMQMRSGMASAPLAITPIAAPISPVLDRFGAIDPALIEVLAHEPPRYGAQAVGLIQPVGVYLVRPALVEPLPDGVPTALPLPDTLNAPATDPDQDARRELARSAAAAIEPECAPQGNPAEGVLTQAFHIYHSGIDIGVYPNTAVQATHSGIVIYADWSEIGYGYLVAVQSGRFVTYYAHNNAFNVQTGDSVQRGQVIAWSGSTGNSSGPHIHYETRLDDIPLNPLTFAARGHTTC